MFKHSNFVKDDANLNCKLLSTLPQYKESDLDTSTYNILKDTHEIYTMKQRIKDLFAENNVWSAKAIIELISKAFI